MISNKDYIRVIPLLKRLNKCPFCGSNVVMMQGIVYGGFAIECQNEECGADVYFYGAELSPEEMAERWNRRTDK